ncbi:carboxymuconolactone decarboxylase family protein [Alteromonadaceae bacterium BrNp21-10]|nr:carboxymuconolactone decarboxylase family protein [Alteromonadaceae bacterium BrNp21-10]
MITLNRKKARFISVAQIMCLYVVAVFESYAVENTDALNDRQQAIIPIAALTASGNISELKSALNAGLDNGLSINEVKEIFIHSYAYAGFPRALNGINAYIQVMDERKQRSITDKLGNEATAVPTDYDANAYGNKVRNELVGRDISNRTTGYAGFVPTIDKFLVEHLFANIFYRDVLTIKDRELVTISILAAIPGTEAQLTSHIKLSLRVGYSPVQLLQFTQVLKDKVGQDSAIRAQTVLKEVADIALKNSEISLVKISKDDSVTLGALDKFSGIAKVTSRFESPVSSDYRGAMVEFEPGARTAWHTHPKGQTLIIISGKGLVQSEGGDIQQMRPGNVVTIPPNTKHWHGASSDSSMSHIAISAPDNGETVNWMELVNSDK